MSEPVYFTRLISADGLVKEMQGRPSHSHDIKLALSYPLSAMNCGESIEFPNFVQKCRTYVFNGISTVEKTRFNKTVKVYYEYRERE